MDHEVCMVEILKINTPITNKNAIPNSKQITESGMPFDLQEVSKVIKPSNQADIHKQNNSLTQRDTSTILTSLLKNPSVTVSFLRNIYILQEIIKLLPINNQTTIQELRSLFDALLISPDEIVDEMIRQKNSSTMFRGELFDFLRTMLADNANEDFRQSVVMLLRSINANINRQDILDSIANNLSYLAEQFAPSKSLHSQITALEQSFRQQDAQYRFAELKTALFELLGNLEESVLYKSDLEKITAILKYNLSRFNTNKEFFRESVDSLLMYINGREDKEHFMTLINQYISSFSGDIHPEANSKIMHVLAEIIGKQAADADIKMLSADTIERIVHSLLSSPCNFTPLLHLVIPVMYQNIRSFAEIWIDPGAKGNSSQEEEDSSNIHMLIVFDIEGLGSFEMELFAAGKQLRLSLLCPKSFLSAFEALESRFAAIISSSSYRLEAVEIGPLERPRSLMDVFKTLPYKRTGIDVRI